MSRDRGLTAIAFIAPLASRPKRMYCVCKSFTFSLATLLMVSCSVLNNLPKVFVAPPAYLKYSPSENLFLSRLLVKDSVVVLIVLMPAENWPVAFTELINVC